MSLMLVAIVATTMVGMFANGSRPTQLKLVLVVAVLLTGLYFVRPNYMT